MLYLPRTRSAMFRAGPDDPAGQAIVSPQNHPKGLDMMAMHMNPLTTSSSHLSPQYSHMLKGPSFVRITTPKNSTENLPWTYPVGGHPMQREFWAPGDPGDVHLNQSQHSMDGELFSLPLKDFGEPLQPLRNIPSASWNLQCLLPGNLVIFPGDVPAIPVSSRQENPGVVQYISDDGPDVNTSQARPGKLPQGQPRSTGNPGAQVPSNCKYSHAHDPSHRAFLFGFYSLHPTLLLPRAGVGRYHPEAFPVFTCL